MIDEKLQKWIEYTKDLPTTGKAALAVIMKKSEILAISRENDLEDFTLLGGKLEPGEDWLTGLVREVREETGLEVISAEIFHQGYSGDKHFVRTYLCKVEDLFAPIKESPEGIVRWVHPDAILKGCFSVHNKKILDALTSHILDRHIVRR